MRVRFPTTRPTLLLVLFFLSFPSSAVAERPTKGLRAIEKREVEIVKHRIEVLRIAMHGLMEIEAIDAANLVEHRIHYYELALAGRRDEEAMRIRKSAPTPDKLVGPLKRAAEAWVKLLAKYLAGSFTDSPT